MDDNKFELDEKQKKLCHELTMEYLRQNESFKKSQYKGKDLFGDHVRNVYFDMYEEIAIGVIDNWDKIQRMYH